MYSKRKEHTKDTEQLILEAAIKEFSTKGFDGARTSVIAAEAGVTHAMLHYYFRTKEKLFEHIFRDMLQRIINLILSPMIAAEGSIKDRIIKGMETHFDFIMANRELPIFFITTINSRPELYKEVIEEFAANAEERVAAFQKELDKAHEKGEIAKVSAATLMCQVASLNVFPFLAYPLLMAATGYRQEDFDSYMAERKRENIATILKRLS